MQRLLRDKVEFQAYTYGKRPDSTELIPNLFSDFEESSAFDILVHLPTCFYDFDYFNAELAASGKRTLNIISRIWYPPINASKTVRLVTIGEVKHLLPEALLNKANFFLTVITEKLDELLTPYISSPAYRSRQTQNIASIYRSQLITYYLLDDFFKAGRPSKALISDHDAGFNGPLLTYLQNNNIPVLLVPHSKTYANLEFDGGNLTALSHPIQDGSISDRNGKRVLHFHLAYPERLETNTGIPDRIRGIGLLLNGFSLNGVYATRYKTYLDGIIKISHWCKANNITLGIRCRPHLPLMSILSAKTNIELSELIRARSVPLLDFAKEYELCLMYDSPTAAALEYLKISIPILNPVPEDLTWAEANTINSDVVPRGSVDTILEMLDTFIADEINFFVFRTTQFRKYINLFNNALPLRHFL